MILMTLINALPLGDDTPIMLDCILGLLAVGLIIAMVLVGKKNKQDPDGTKSDKRDRK